MIDVRMMTADDLLILSEYWYDQTVLYQQTHQLIQLLPDAQARWTQEIGKVIAAPDVFALTCEVQSSIVGGLIGQICRNKPGLSPEYFGFVQYLVVDLHTEHRRKQVASSLLQPFVAYLRENGLHSLVVDVPIHALIEQGFWRGTGARKMGERFWMTL